MRYATVLFGLGWLIVLVGAAMLVPVLTAAAAGNNTSSAIFLLTASLTFFVGVAMIMAVRGVQRRPRTVETLLFVVLGWFVAPLFAAIPFYATGALPGWSEAYFEALSGFTTTGASLVERPEDLVPSLLVWRAMSQWLGGFATIIMAVALLAPLGVGALELRRTPLARGEGDSLMARLRGTAAVVLPLYTALTVAAFVAIWQAGIPAFDAFCLSLSTISTGGFTTRSDGLGAYGAPFAVTLLAVFMALGALNFASLWNVSRGRWRDGIADPELRYFAFVAVCGGVLVASALMSTVPEASLLAEIDRAMFLSLSLLSTTGFMVRPADLGPALPVALVAGLTLIGGATLSTAGGLKIMRVALLVKQGGRELARLAHPHGILSIHFGERSVSVNLMSSIWALFALTVAVTGALMVILTATGLPFDVSLIAAVSAIANAGPLLDMVRVSDPSMTDYEAMPEAARAALMAGMVIGRVEVLALLSLFNLSYWRK